MKKLAAIAAVGLMPSIALCDPLIETRTPGNELTQAPAHWLGATPHLVIMGTAAGHPFDVQLMNGDLKQVHELVVKREYLKTSGSYSPYREIDMNLSIVLEGVAKQIEAKLTYADFNQIKSLPASLRLQSFDEFPAGDRIYSEFEFEWEGGGKSVNKELAEWRGTATINHDDGIRAQVPNADGMIGGYINSKNGRDNIVISFFLPASEFEVDD